MLKIGFDAKRIFHNFTGLGNYSRELVEGLLHYFPDYQYHLFSPKIRQHPRTQPFLDSKKYHIHTASKQLGSWWRTVGIIKDIKRSDIQLYHGLSHEIPINIHKSGTKSVVTIHDLVFKKYPELYGAIDRKMYDWKFRYACEHADKIIAISQSTKRDIVDYYGIVPNKIEVIYQTCHHQFFSSTQRNNPVPSIQSLHFPPEYLLYVGSIIPRKRLLSIVKALQISIHNIPLVVIGDGKTYKEEVKSYVKKHHLEQRVVFAEHIPFSAFPAIYKQAKAFIYPSIYEGFGIPIIEALYSKTPVITSNLSSLPEAAGPGALYVEPDTPEDIAQAIDQILTYPNVGKQLVDKGFEYVQQFNPKDISYNIMSIYHEVSGLPFEK